MSLQPFNWYSIGWFDQCLCRCSPYLIIWSVSRRMKVPRLTEPNPVKCIFTQESSCFSYTENNTFFRSFFGHPFPKKEKKSIVFDATKNKNILEWFQSFKHSSLQDGVLFPQTDPGLEFLSWGRFVRDTDKHRDWATWVFKVHGHLW